MGNGHVSIETGPFFLPQKCLQNKPLLPYFEGMAESAPLLTEAHRKDRRRLGAQVAPRIFITFIALLFGGIGNSFAKTQIEYKVHFASGSSSIPDSSKSLLGEITGLILKNRDTILKVI